MKIYMRDLPENYTPARPQPTPCGLNQNQQPIYPQRHAMRRFKHNPTGLGLSNIEELLDTIYSLKNNHNGLGLKVERVGDESEMSSLLEQITDMMNTGAQYEIK